MGGTTHGSATRGHAIADELIPAEHVEQLELQRVGVDALLHNTADDDSLDTDETPVLEIDICAVGGLLQHL